MLNPYILSAKGHITMLAAGAGDHSKLLMAVSGQVIGSDEKAGERSRALTVKTMQNLFGPISEEGHAFQSFETTNGLIRAEAVTLEGIDFWSLRCSAPDIDVPGRDIIVDVTSLIEADQTLFSCRMSLYSSTQNFEFAPKVPPVLTALCASGDLNFQCYGHDLPAYVQHIGTDIDVTTLLRQLSDPHRWWDCIVVSHSAGAINAQALQADLTGLANVFVLPDHKELEFAAAVGHDFNVPDRGARTYRPGFDFMSSEVTAHPVHWPPDAAAATVLHESIGLAAFETSVSSKDTRFRAPSFVTVKQLANRKRSDDAKINGDKEAQFKALEALARAERRNAAEAIALAIQSDDERQLAQDALANEQAVNHGLRHRIETLEKTVQNMGGLTQTTAPDRYSDLKHWVSDNFSGKLRLTPRAEKGLSNARYEKIADVTAALKLLAEDYRDMRMGNSDPDSFAQACRALGIEETRSLSKVSAGQHGEAYFVTYAGKRRFLDRHLKKGNTKDERLCMRIYFFWDQANQSVVVGSLPSHLPV